MTTAATAGGWRHWQMTRTKNDVANSKPNRRLLLQLHTGFGFVFVANVFSTWEYLPAIVLPRPHIFFRKRIPRPPNNSLKMQMSHIQMSQSEKSMGGKRMRGSWGKRKKISKTSRDLKKSFESFWEIWIGSVTVLWNSKGGWMKIYKVLLSSLRKSY